MSSLEDKIIWVLRASGNAPMKAADIAKKISESQCAKKNVNQLIFKMVETEKAEPVEQPPKWRLKDKYISGAPQQQGAAANHTNQEVPKLDCVVSVSQAASNYTQTEQPQNQAPEKDASSRDNVALIRHILSILDFRSGPVSGVVIAKALGMQSRSDVNPILYELEKQGLIKSVHKDSDAKPLWELASNPISPHTSSQANQRKEPSHEVGETDEVLYRKSNLSDGSVKFTPQQGIHSGHASATAIGAVHYPAQETLSNSTANVEVPPPIQETLSNAPAEETSPSTSKKAEQKTENLLNNTSQSNSPGANAPSKRKRKIQLAANFNSSPTLTSVENIATTLSTVGIESRDADLRDRLLQQLKTGKRFSALQLSKLLESHTDLAEEITAILVSLSEEGKVVEEAEREGMSVWRLALIWI